MKKEMTVPGYLITETLHEGESTLVLRANDTRDNRKVILKTLVDGYTGGSQAQLLVKEYDTLISLRIPGICKVYELLYVENRPVLVMEDAEGQDLKSFYRNGCDLFTFFEVAIQLADIISRIHANNIIHKNINPANIIISKATGDIRIIDFTIACRHDRECDPLPPGAEPEGTLAYMSPEQTGRMNRRIDHRTDLYALGVSFYELLTGKLPFQAADAMEMVHAHIAKKMEPPTTIDPHIPTVLSDIVLKLTAKNPEDRYQSAMGLKHDLEVCMEKLRSNLIDDYFSIGRKDVSTTFRISGDLYGREKELEELQEATDVVANGWCQLVLISGSSGIGKTALVQEMHKTAPRKNGYFISGKVDQFKSNIPFNAFTHAFSDLLRQLVSEPADKLEKIKHDLFESLGLNASILTDLLPEFKTIIGNPDTPPQLNPVESQNRFFFTLNDFIRVFAKPEHPLTIFLDDLQWCDDASFRLIRDLISKEIPYLLIIGAYRNNEVTEGHPLSITIGEIRKRKRIHELPLHPLQEEDINRLFADTLMCDPQDTRQLSRILFKRTAGNPFYIKELMKRMYHEGLIRFDYTYGKWTWDLEKISALDISENVVEFLSGRLNELPEDSLRLIQTGACIGNTFTLSALAMVSGLSPNEVADNLWRAVDEEILLSSRGSYRMLPKDQEAKLSYRFQHDRIQQAAYHLIDPEKRRVLHLTIGRMLQRHLDPQEKQEKITELARHFNEALVGITDPDERVTVAEMNLAAGKKAQAAVAYAAALQYFKKGVEALPLPHWQQHYKLTFELYAGFAQNAYQVNEFDTAEECIRQLLNHAKTNLEKVSVLSMKVRQYNTVGKAQEAINAGIEGLALMGMHLEKNPGPLTVAKEVLVAKYRMRFRKAADLLQIPLLVDPEKKAAARLLTEIAPSAYISGNDNLWALTQLKVVNLSLAYGNCTESPYAYISFGTILKELTGDLHAAEEFGKLSLALNDKLNDIEFRCRLIAAYGVLTHHFNHHWSTTNDWFKKGIEAGFFSGDVFFLAHCVVNCTVWNPSLTLAESLLDQQKYLQLIKDTQFADAYDTALMNIQRTKNFMGLTDHPTSLSDSGYNEVACLEDMQRRKYLSGTGMYYIHKAEVYLHNEEYTQAVAAVEKAEEFVKSLVSLIYLTRLCWIAFFSYAGQLRTGDSSNMQALRKKMTKALSKMKKWAAYNPLNFLHLQLLMEAEVLQLAGRTTHAALLYDKAITTAKQNKWPADEAYANELTAKFYTARSMGKAASGYWREACYLYEVHGASGKIRFLKNTYPQFFKPTNSKRPVSEEGSAALAGIENDHSVQALDVTAITRSSQAISEEIVLESLLGKMMRIIMMNAGAEKGYLLLERHEKLYIQASGDGDKIVSMQNLPVKESESLPQTIINYVTHLREAVVLDDAGEQGDFINDKYIRDVKPKSVLCSPILLLNKLYGIIYLENSISPGAFTKERLHTLQILSSQMAISIQNAMMYANLEEEVQARTLELSREKKRSDDLLFNILPEGVANELKATGTAEAKQFDDTTVLFSDFVDFTKISETLSPKELVSEVHACFTAFDTIMDKHGLEKIKTIGDAYLAVCGLPQPVPDHALKAVHAALDILSFMKTRKENGGLFDIRIGINSGSVVAGIVGVKKFVYDIWSDTVNTAARMESNSEKGRINVSATTYDLIKNHFKCTARPVMHVKSKGLVEMYFVEGKL